MYLDLALVLLVVLDFYNIFSINVRSIRNLLHLADGELTMSKLFIVHVSDLHVDSAKDAEIGAMTDALCKKISLFREERGINSLDLLVVSGDLVNRGTNSYELVEKRLEEILSSSNIPRDRVFLVPGNHDVDWTMCKKSSYYNDTTRRLREDPNEFTNIEKDVKASRELERPFKRYNTYAKKFPLLRSKEKRKFRFPGFACVDLAINSLPIRLCGVNTALIAGPNDDGSDEEMKNRCCGFPYLSEMLRSSDRYLNIVVSHYPLSWIHVKERKKVRQLLQQSKALLLTGHMHEGSAETSGLTDTQLIQLSAGSAYGARWEGRNHCRILEFDSERKNMLLHDWVWFGDFGWRAFEPLPTACAGWDDCRTLLKGDIIIERDMITSKARQAGLIDIRNWRTEAERVDQYVRIINAAAPGSDLLIVGRSLRNWAFWT